MRVKELHIRNWRVIREADFDNLSDFVVVAGPNGVGKTKIKEAIVHIFQNGGNPPEGSRVVLEATNAEERATWTADELTLPDTSFWSMFGVNNKRLKTKSRLIQIDSNRSVESISFQQLTFQAIGDPETEEVGPDYGFQNVKNRFNDICRTLQRLKSKEVTSVYNAYQSKLQPDQDSITLQKLEDPTEHYIKTFSELLYPKRMVPIDINSSTIQYYDDDGTIRQFSDLSSGEREVVILTFDILTQHPSDCLILIDEPEVHLHPELTFRLVKVLRSIGERNQYFLFTHSADLIASALDSGVHFVRPKATAAGNQVVRIDEQNLETLGTIPNIRETIGMISVGRKLLFVEGRTQSIDRNVFATLAKSAKVDVAIVPSDSCSNINNMALMCETLMKGIYGVELFMVRDRDGLVDEQLELFTTKSKGHLQFLPFYHIENSFLLPDALHSVAKDVLMSKAPDRAAIEERLVALAKNQIMSTATLYVNGEIYFKSGNVDITPKLDITSSTTIEQVSKAMVIRRVELFKKYEGEMSEERINERLEHWKNMLEKSLENGWSENARKFFIGKRLLRETENRLFATKQIRAWEHIANSDDPSCLKACSELRSILEKV